MQVANPQMGIFPFKMDDARHWKETLINSRFPSSTGTCWHPSMTQVIDGLVFSKNALFEKSL